MNANDALRAALTLATEGVPVLPVAPNKRPCTPHGYRDASAELDTVRRLWRQHPASHVALATGALSGRDVLDIDAGHSEAAAWWSANRARLPATFAYRTRSGGLHLHFRHAKGVRCSASRIAPGVDVRGDGGMAIYWPAAGLPVLSTAPVAPWPEWILRELVTPPASQRAVADGLRLDDRRLAGLVRLVATATEGSRNAALYWAACRVAEEGAERDFAARALVLAAMRAGLPEAEAVRTVRSALNHGR